MASTEESHDPVAFAEKLRHWRETGGLSVTLGGRNGNVSRKDFHEQPSRFAQERAHVAELKAKGVEFERARR